MNICIQIAIGAALIFIIYKLNKMDELLQRLNAATNEIAADLERLRGQLGDVLTPEQKAALTAQIERLEQLGVDPANPVPEA